MSEVSCHLILVHSRDWQDVSDFYAIKTEVEKIAPDIGVFIASNDIPSSTTRRAAARCPTLVFSPIALIKFKPDRGRLYVGRPMSKLDEMKRLAAAGIAVPEFEALTAATHISEDKFGPYSILKPSYAYSSYGSGIELRKTASVKFKPQTDYPNWHPGHKAPMVIQRFIDTGYPMTCRVLTFFGETIFTYMRRSTKRLDLPATQTAFEQHQYMPSPPDIEVSLTKEPEFLDFAKRVYAAMPEVALQGCDIIKEETTGKLYILETNPGGGTWMFSNSNAGAYRRVLGVENLWEPFDAFRTCARVLVERTRAEAE
jgi:hypothetical protein